jgi:hypothetical protein
MTLPVDRQKDLVQVPLVPGPRPPATELIGIILPELLTPPADGFVGDVDAPFQEELLHVAVTQREAIIEPDTVTDDFARETVVLVALGVSGRGHVGS